MAQSAKKYVNNNLKRKNFHFKAKEKKGATLREVPSDFACQDEGSWRGSKFRAFWALKGSIFEFSVAMKWDYRESEVSYVTTACGPIGAELCEKQFKKKKFSFQGQTKKGRHIA